LPGAVVRQIRGDARTVNNRVYHTLNYWLVLTFNYQIDMLSKPAMDP